MAGFSESHVEDAALGWLSKLGYAVLHGPDISPEGPAPERISYDQVLLTSRLRKTLKRLNPNLPAETLEEVLRKVQQTETPSLIEENRRLHRYLIEGVPVEIAREDGSIGGDFARLIDFENVDANDWLVVNQYTVVEHSHNRRPDVVLFVNGLPLAVLELKNPGDENATLEGAFNQLQTYKDQIPSLFRTNAALVTSDGIQARLGSLTADIERFMPWRTVDGSVIAPKGTPELETLQGAPGIARQAGQRPRRLAQAGYCPGHVADGLRRAKHAHDVHRQAHAGARAHAGDRASEPRIPR